MADSDSDGSSEPSCSYTFSPDDWEAGSDRESQLDESDLTDGVWQCPHSPEAGHEVCLFHLPPDERPADISVGERLLDILGDVRDVSPRRDRRPLRQFIGAKLPELRLDAAVIDADDNYPLDFRHAEIGTFSCINGTITHDLWLDGARITDELTITGHIGTFRLSSGDLTGAKLDLSGSVFETVEITATPMQELVLTDVRAEHATFDGFDIDSVDGRSAQFTQLEFNNIDADSVDFGFLDVRRADFNGLDLGKGNFYFADIDEADFRTSNIDHAVLKEVTFSGGYFNNIDFGIANFIGCDIERGHFTDASIGEGSFHDSSFETKVDFTDGHLGWVNFQQATVEQGFFRDCTLEQVNFRGTTFVTANFERVDCAGALTLADIRVTEDLTVEPASDVPPADTYISLRRSELSSATLAQPKDGKGIYDLEDATLGDTQFMNPSGGVNLLERIRFFRTQFEKFDFRDNDDIDPWNNDFKIHGLSDVDADELNALIIYGKLLFSLRLNDGRLPHTGSEPKLNGSYSRSKPRGETDGYDNLRATCEEISTQRGAALDKSYVQLDFLPGELETTYLRAKNGANQVHDNESASAFFQKEMRQRRYRYRDQMVTELTGWRERLDGDISGMDSTGHHLKRFGRSAVSWVSNLILEVTSSYGEKPSYVVFSSVAVVLCFGSGYAVAFPSLYDQFGQYFLLSFGSFVSFILGPTGDVTNSMVGFLTQVEGFIGAFFIALFVFTLTRSIHR